MNQDIIQQAYTQLIAIPDSKNDNILYRLSDWLSDFLDDDKDKVLYYSLPIWDYLKNMWDPEFPMCISRQNDSYFKKKTGWYKNYNTNEIVLKKTDFGRFYTEANLNAQGFSFVEFITQNATTLQPVFTIRFIDETDSPTKYDLDVEHGVLSMFNNRVSEENRALFIESTYRLLVKEQGLIDDNKTKDLGALYEFLCIYQQSFKLKYIYLITSRLFKEDGRNVSSGGLILVCKEALDLEKLYLISFIVNLCYREKGGKNWEERCLRESVKSAKSAIMSRNMSHNLGSHVMAYLKQHLSSVTTMLNDNVLTRLCGDKVDYDKLLDYLEKNVPGFKTANDSNTPANVSPIDKVSSRLALPFLVGLGQFVSYLQERQDFIATISTDYIPYYATVNFKDSIYDELNPDKRYERHQDRKNLQLDNILLGNIARSEGLGRPTSPTKENGGRLCDIVLKFNDFDGNPCKEGTPAYDSLEDLRRFNVSLPGGIVGRQAVFSIVENIIRNAAKHGSWRDIGKLELTFRKYDLLSDPIPDNDNLDGHKSLREVINAYYRPAIDINDLYVVTLTDNTECSEEALHKLRKALDDDYVDSSGIMKSANKGLKEMRISAAWIRSIKDESSCVNMQLTDREDAEYISKQGLRAPVIYARIATDENLGEHLQYIFCLPKPKVLAIVSDSLSEQRRGIQIEGCRFYSEKEFELENNKSYEFILCGNDKYERIRPFASARTFTFDESGISREELLAVKDDATLQLLLERLYKNETIFGYTDGDVINIDDKKAHDNLERHIEDYKETSLPIDVISIVKEESEADGISTFAQNDPSVKGLVLGSYYRRGHVFVSDGKVCGQYIYRTHHDSFEQFSKFMDSKVSPQFVEGITGNNSTDRLIRNEVIDESWFYRHLHAMKIKVAICDERLFSKVTGLEETDFTRGKVKLANKDNFDEIKQYYTNLSPEDSLTISGFDSPEKLNKYVDNNFRIVLQEPERLSKGLSASSYSQRGIYVFSFIQDAEVAAKYYLVGVYMEKKTPEDVLSPVYKDTDNHQFECKCARLAELTWSNVDGLSINSDNFKGGQYCNHFFDYLTIHQGLLDKLYEAFGIKDNPECKDLLTRGLYEYFCKQEKQKIIPVKVKTPEKVEERTFLSGMMVHSGRSKPGLQDMPQVLPFIQYAALEHAVMDCKFSLVELLDHARYEL